MEIKSEKNKLQIVKKWFDVQIFTVFFIIWCFFTTFLSIVTYKLMTNFNINNFNIDIDRNLFIFLFPLGWLLLTYILLCLILNKTLITVTSQQVEIKNEPIPSFGNITIKVQDIKQFYIEKWIRSHDRSIHEYFQLWLKTKSGKKKCIINRLENYSQGELIKEKIEKFLGIDEKIIDEQKIDKQKETAPPPVSGAFAIIFKICVIIQIVFIIAVIVIIFLYYFNGMAIIKKVIHSFQ
ncbi:MAG: hypothetical protein HQK53_18065 [Oligoflexia bacterium]|nr:hypothetical protein [Oligoflexia bacterium]